MNKKLIAVLVSSFLIGGMFCEATTFSRDWYGELSDWYGENGSAFRRRPNANPTEKSWDTLDAMGNYLQKVLYGDGLFSRRNVIKYFENLENYIQENNYSGLRDELGYFKGTISTLKTILDSYKKEINSLFEWHDSTKSTNVRRFFNSDREEEKEDLHKYLCFDRGEKKETPHECLYETPHECFYFNQEERKKTLMNELKGSRKFSFWNKFKRMKNPEACFEIEKKKFCELVGKDLRDLRRSFSLLREDDLLEEYKNAVRNLGNCLFQLNLPHIKYQADIEDSPFSGLLKAKYELLEEIKKSYGQIEMQIELLSRFKFFDDLLEISVRE
jgi:hypothetical protein